MHRFKICDRSPAAILSKIDVKKFEASVRRSEIEMASFFNKAAQIVADGIRGMKSLQSMGVQLHVATEKGTYTAGELVTGKVWINSAVPIPIQAIRIKISGFENCTVIEHKYVSEEDDIEVHRNRARREFNQPRHGMHGHSTRIELSTSSHSSRVSFL